MKKTTMAVLVLLAVGIIAAGASAFGGFGGWGKGSAVRDAIEANDYDAWKTAASAELTEERFDKMVEKHNAMSERRGEMMQQKVEMEAAFEAGDFEAWKALMEARPRAAPFELTQENFDKMADMHEAKDSGDMETFNDLREELGMTGFGKGGRHGGKGGSCDGGCGGCPFSK